ncbi:hypothetical protein AUJ87_02065 [Candidatus Gracilibacteria bacterium CG1_02_38_174]|nr:MAG: hypothetical protein AUJ87_02065 [Candidatus Gracilibacteria bacterium CG1_02_38_174]PIQ12185.1 MAG: hypothetical protein COW68_00725 [Candidatus Gracilibacteria bacterium CG18_big_fil_WC_8_21_14_2_50_38_16]PIQ41110.1 MAG: hypothetical protein COW06_03995 [Candidatus Gracilibacteria bacterium CG12_big_fil_rev_8_21_14_0_65_38_15]PIZ01504.1 MAG: hypothetical protein COY60_03190 [Candidatus Gracilibacteria bacterium CG_4_10_14_0_8_um_filter_38_28]
MKTYLALSLLTSLLFTSCSVDWNGEKQTKDDLFKKKQECAKNISQVEKEFSEWKSNYTEGHKLYELFYSPKLNTCLKAYTLIGGLTERVTVYAIDDIFSKENIFQKSTGEVSDFEVFENKIKELKGE